MNFDLTEEQVLFRDMVREFAEKEIAPVIDDLEEKEEFPTEIAKKMADLGLWGLPFPEEYGGAGADLVTYAIGVEEISRWSASLGITMAAHTSLGSMPIFFGGTEEQKQKWLTPLASGEKFGAFGLTEPEAGSDAGNTKTTAVLDNGEWVINGRKEFITNSGLPNTQHVTVTAVTGEKDGRKQISSILVPAGTPGFEVEKAYRKMGWHCSDTHPLSFSDCRVPQENLLGEEGGGFKQFMKTLDCGRIGVAALSVGTARACLEESVKYAKERVQFGKPIGKNQGIAFKIVDMDMEIELARLATLKAAWLRDQDRPYSREAAIAKLYASEVCMRVATNAVQVFGGYGYIEEYPVCRYFRDTKILEIGEGSSEVQRIVLARALGL